MAELTFKELKKDVSYKPKFTAIEYKYNLVLNGGTVNGGGTNSDVINYKVTDTAELPTPVKDGYKFKGWYASPNFTGESITEAKLGTENYYAKWEPIVYTVTFDLGTPTNGKPYFKYKSLSFTYDNLPLTLGEPVCEGYKFSQWVNDESFGAGSSEIKKDNFQRYFNDNVTENLVEDHVTTFKAVWSEDLSNVTEEIYLEQDGVSGMYDLVETINGKCYTGEEFGKSGSSNNRTSYSVEGFSETQESLDTTVTVKPQGTVLKRYFNRNTYTVTLNINETYGSTKTELKSFKYNDAPIDLPEVISYGRYSFLKWVDSEGNAVTHIPAYTKTNVTYYAVFSQTAPEFGKDFKVNYSTKGSTIEVTDENTTSVKGFNPTFLYPGNVNVTFNGTTLDNGIQTLLSAKTIYRLKIYRNAPVIGMYNTDSDNIDVQYEAAVAASNVKLTFLKSDIAIYDGANVVVKNKYDTVTIPVGKYIQLGFVETNEYYASERVTFGLENNEEITTLNTVEATTDGIAYVGTDKKATVNFNGNNSSTIKYRLEGTSSYTELKSNEAIIDLNSPTRLYYVVQENSKFPSGERYIDIDYQTVNVTFKSDENTTLAVLNFIKGQSFVDSQDYQDFIGTVRKHGYKFVKWVNSSKEEATKAIDENLTVTANWTANKGTVTVSQFAVGHNVNDCKFFKFSTDFTDITTETNYGDDFTVDLSTITIDEVSHVEDVFQYIDTLGNYVLPQSDFKPESVLVYKSNGNFKNITTESNNVTIYDPELISPDDLDALNYKIVPFYRLKESDESKMTAAIKFEATSAETTEYGNYVSSLMLSLTGIDGIFKRYSFSGNVLNLYTNERNGDYTSLIAGNQINISNMQSSYVYIRFRSGKTNGFVEKSLVAYDVVLYNGFHDYEVTGDQTVKATNNWTLAGETING